MKTIFKTYSRPPAILYVPINGLLGAGLGLGLAYFDDISHPWNKAMGGQDSYAMARGMGYIGLIIIGGILGVIIGEILHHALREPPSQ